MSFHLSHAIAKLPGNKKTATRVGIAAAVVGAGYLAAPYIAGAYGASGATAAVSTTATTIGPQAYALGGGFSQAVVGAEGAAAGAAASSGITAAGVLSGVKTAASLVGAAGTLAGAIGGRGQKMAADTPSNPNPPAGTAPRGDTSINVQTQPNPASAAQIAKDGNNLNFISIIVGVVGIAAAIYFGKGS